MSEGLIYVCDHCGHIEIRDAIPEGAEWTCEACGSNAVWEFPPERRAHAESHSIHIQRAAQTGLFRRAS